MLDEKKGIALTEHSGFFRTYRECFSGKDAVDWLIQTLNGGNIERSNGMFISMLILQLNNLLPFRI